MSEGVSKCSVREFHGWLNTFLAYLLFLSNPTRIKASNAKRKYILHIHNIEPLLMFEQLLANKRDRLRDSLLFLVWPSGDLRQIADKTTKKKNKPRVD